MKGKSLKITHHQVPGEASHRPWKKIKGWSFGTVTVFSPRTRAMSWTPAKAAANPARNLRKSIIKRCSFSLSVAFRPVTQHHSLEPPASFIFLNGNSSSYSTSWIDVPSIRRWRSKSGPVLRSSSNRMTLGCVNHSERIGERKDTTVP